MEQKTNKLNVKIIISIVIVSLVIVVATMIYKYFETREKLINYKNKYEKAMLKIEEIEKGNVRNEEITKESIENLTNEELRKKLIEYKNKYEEVILKLTETEKKLEEYRENSADNSQVTQGRQHNIFRRGNYTYFNRQ